MFRPTVMLLVALALLASNGRGLADVIFTATLTNAQENPPVVPTTTLGGPRPASFGQASFVFDEVLNQLRYSATVFNIDFTGLQTADVNDNLVAAHIHAPAPPGINAGVVFGFFGLPFHETPKNDVINTPFATGVGGTISGVWDASEGVGGLATQLPFILAEQAYINFHTTQFGGGEVRGQITVIPEPSSIALLGVGALGLIGYGWRRMRVG